MNAVLKKLLVLFSRFCISIVFIHSSVYQMKHFTEVQQFMAGKGLIFTELLLALSILWLLLGGFSVFLGIKAKKGSILLMLFLIPATLIFHSPFAEQAFFSIQFFKNLAIFGALLQIYIYGSGPLSLKP